MPTRYEDDKKVLAVIAKDAADLARAAIPSSYGATMRADVAQALVILLGGAYLTERTRYRVTPPPGPPAPKKPDF